MYKLFWGLCLIIASTGHTKEKLKGDYLQSLNGNVGFRSVSLTDTAKVTGGTFSGSAIQWGLEYPFYKTVSRSYFIKASSPLISNIGTGLYSSSLGIHFFFNRLSAPYQITDNSSSLIVRPTTQFYWGVEVGGGSMIYTIENAKKNDFVFLLGAHGGVIKQWTEKWAFKSDIGIDRGFGINTTLMTYYLDLGLVYNF